MAEEILSQAEIDALLQMIGEEPDAGGAWQPGEEESLQKVGRLIAEAASGAWQAQPGLAMRILPPAVDRLGAGAMPVNDGPGVWAVASLSGAARGQMAFWLGAGLLRAFAEKALGTPLSPDVPPPQEVERVGKALSAFFAPLGEALGGLAGAAVAVEPVEAQWASQADALRVLQGVPGFEGDLVRWVFSCQAAGIGGELVAVWSVEDARAFLGRVVSGSADAGAGAAGPPPPSAPGGGGAATAPAARGADFQPFGDGEPPPVPHNIELILDVPLGLTVELGRTEKAIRDILALGPGSLVELDRLAGESVDVMVNGKLIAKGEVVVVDENFGVRITEIVSRAERVRKLR